MPERQWPKDFKDRLTTPLPGLSHMWKILREGGFSGDGKQAHDAPNVPRGDGRLPDLTPGQSSLTWVGHATYLVRTGGINVLADPVWTDKLPGPRSHRLTPPGIAFEDLPPIDAVVISHNHYDHQDKPTLLRLPKRTPMLVPGASATWFRKLGFTDVRELDWYQSTRVGTLDVDFVPSHHWSRRGLFDTCRHLWGGWVITSAHHRLYHAGDTGYGHFFHQIGKRYPGIDAAMLPIGAYAPRWFMKPVHTDPDEAIQALDDLGAKRMATMHWGTFVLTAEPFLEPMVRTQAAWAKSGRDMADLWDLALGETRILG